MPRVRYRLRGQVVPHGGAGGWRFITLPKHQAVELRALFAGLLRGTALPATATIGATTWRTSVFAAKGGGFVLPVKASVRQAEGIADGATVDYEVEVAA